MAKKWIKVEILRSLIEEIDVLVSEGRFSSRQSAANFFLRKGLEKHEHPVFPDTFSSEVLGRLEHIEKQILKLLETESEDQK